MVNAAHASFVMSHTPVLNTFSLIVQNSKNLGFNFKFSLMSHPLGGKNSLVLPAKAVGLPLRP